MNTQSRLVCFQGWEGGYRHRSNIHEQLMAMVRASQGLSDITETSGPISALSPVFLA
jgi:hypothetical protein